MPLVPTIVRSIHRDLKRQANANWLSSTCWPTWVGVPKLRMYSMRTRSEKSTARRRRSGRSRARRDAGANGNDRLAQDLVQPGGDDRRADARSGAARGPGNGGRVLPAASPARPPGPAVAGAASPNVRMDKISLCDLAGVLCNVSLTILRGSPHVNFDRDGGVRALVDRIDVESGIGRIAAAELHHAALDTEDSSGHRNTAAE